MTKENANELFTIGEKVLSLDLGLCRITAIVKLQTDGNYYYVIQCGDKRLKNYFPIKNNQQIRQISSKERFEKVLKIFKHPRCLMNLNSKKERQAYFDRPLKKNDIEKIILRICELISIIDLNNREKKVLDFLVKTIELEKSIIFKITLKESKKLISKLLTHH